MLYSFHLKLTLTIFCIIFFHSALTDDYKILDKIVATAEKDVITESEIRNEILNNLEIKDLSKIPTSDLKKIRTDVLKKLIEKKVILQYAESINLLPSQQEIEMVVSNIASNNNITIEELEKEITNDGLSFQEFKNDLRYKLTIQKIKDREIMPYINISEYEIDGWIKNKQINSENEFKIFHILLKQDNPNKDKAIKEIKSIKNNIDFSEIATKYSDGPNALNGGELGWKKIQDLPEIFADFILQAKPGEISGFIESPNGSHVLLVEDIKTSQQEKILVRQYKFQQILLKNSSIVDNIELENKLKNINNLVSDGLEFSEAVKRYSDDQFNIDPKKLEWINYNNLLPEFRLNLSEYPKKDIIGPFKTEMGWHLVKIYDFREQDFTNEAEKQTAKIEIARNKTEIRFKDWIDALIKNSKIKYFED